MKIQEITNKRNKLVADIRAIIDRAQSDNDRAFTADEKRQITEMEADEARYDEQIAILSRQEARESAQSASAGRRSSENALSNDSARNQNADELRSFAAWAACHPTTRTDEYVRLANRSTSFNPYNRELVLDLSERANTDTTSGAVGGYLVADAFKQGITKAQKKFGSVYGAARILKTPNGAPLPFDLFNDVTSNGALIAQGAASGYLDVSFDQVVLGAFKVSSNAVAVSSEALQDSFYDLPGLLGEALGERIARKANQLFTTGAGTTEPYGIVTGATFTRPANGTSMSTSITCDQVLDLIHAVDPSYRIGASFMMPDAQVLKFRKLKNESNDYVWQENTRVGEPSTLFGYPIHVNQDMATPAANAKSVLFGDLNSFVVREVASIRLVRADELLVLNDQVLFVAYARFDSRLINPGVTNIVRGHQYAQAES